MRTGTEQERIRVLLLLRLGVITVCLGLYLVNSIWLKPIFPGSLFLHGYFHDILAMPVVLATGGIGLLLLGRRLPASPVLLIFMLCCAIFWEIGGLFLVPGSVADPADLAAYFFGTLLYLGTRCLSEFCWRLNLDIKEVNHEADNN